MLKLGNRSKSDHSTYLWGWIKKPIAQSSIYKCSYANDTIERGPMMWMSFVMDGNKQEEKWLVIKCKTLKWSNTNNEF